MERILEIEDRKKYLVARGGCIFYYVPNYYPSHKDAYDILLREIPWQRFNNNNPVHKEGSARLSCFMGSEGTYYPNSSKKATPWHYLVSEMKNRLETDLGYEINSCLLNYYPNGNIGISNHKDRECGGKDNVTIGITLGATRDMVLKQDNIVKEGIKVSCEDNIIYEHNSQGQIYRIVYPVRSGDLYFMGGYFHAAWTHEIPKRVKVKEGRISLTFRKLF